MTADRLRPGQLANRQSDDLARYVRDEVYPFSRLYRAALDRCGLGQRGVRTVADLRRLPVTDLVAVGDGHAALLEPAGDVIRSYAPLELRLRLRLADLTSQRERFARDHLDPAFKPLVWLRQAGLHLAYTAADLNKLADLGRRLLEGAGVRSADRVATLDGPGSLAFLQISLGCRAGGVAVVHLGPRATHDDLAVTRPTVLVGPLHAVSDLLADEAGAAVRIVIITGDALDEETRAAVAAVARKGATVRAAWAPPGARALWGECGAGELHTWPDAEVLEIVDPLTDKPAATDADGQLLWSALGWRGTALLRLRTVTFGRVEEAQCICGRTTPRLSVVSLGPTFAAVLDGDPRVADWCAEIRTGAHGDELTIFVAPNGRVASGLAQSLADELGAEVSVVRRQRIRAFVKANDGNRVAESSDR